MTILHISMYPDPSINLFKQLLPNEPYQKRCRGWVGNGCCESSRCQGRLLDCRAVAGEGGYCRRNLSQSQMADLVELLFHLLLNVNWNKEGILYEIKIVYVVDTVEI